ncbi:MAG: S-methyl-5-thioribose-1-phosphate isomerase [Gammaproteobacteria bacterium]|nr:S-methyl-5-thioribose-1-phosphate isomerase [Gammaproteobacteria bacterium]
MNVDGVAYRSIWINADGWSIDVIDQTRLPHVFEVRNLQSVEDACIAIRDMMVRGAPLIGATAAYGYYLAMREDSSDSAMQDAWSRLFQTRPTAVNLRWALDRLYNCLQPLKPGERVESAFLEAGNIAELDVETNQAIAAHGLELIRQIANQKPRGESVNILTHCNAGWLATVDWGTATAPVYRAHDEGIPIHVWVDETRPRNQGASLTAWELGHHGVPHSLIVDNLGGHLMQHGMVDLCLVGSDRTTRSGDVCNKVGTYLKALAAKDNGVPFYVCLPSTTIDWSISDGASEVTIEQRDETEVSEVMGKLSSGDIGHVTIAPQGTGIVNYAFDVTPARLITGLITERAIVNASEDSLAGTFPELCLHQA